MKTFANGGMLIYAKDVIAMSAFYESILGMRVEFADDQYRILADGDAQLILHAIPAQIAADITIAVPPEPREEQAIKPMFAVANIADAERAAERCGGRLIGATWEMSGQRIRDVCDPEGNIVQLLGESTTMKPLKTDTPDSPSDTANWCVMRVDDNANEFVVRDGLSFADASALAAELEARGHKQMYWVRRA